jgi:hypothetical protein
MFDKIETIRRTTFAFPGNRFIEYEESDLEWAAPIGYAVIIGIQDNTQKNGKYVGGKIYSTDSYPGPYNNAQLITKHEILSSTLVLNPFSNWRPTWNPELVG